ncbi:hypothetical protein [Paraburkholderia fungorum]|uniref:hypothetical protein n=1 Tax=Paraburkholderia fungorum TaxID=134537 RepID=UPI0038B97916
MHGLGQVFVTGFALGCESPGGDNFTVEAMAGAWSGGASRGLLHIGRMAKQRLTLNLPNDFVPDSHQPLVHLRPVIRALYVAHGLTISESAFERHTNKSGFRNNCWLRDTPGLPFMHGDNGRQFPV